MPWGHFIEAEDTSDPPRNVELKITAAKGEIALWLEEHSSGCCMSIMLKEEDHDAFVRAFSGAQLEAFGKATIPSRIHSKEGGE